MSDDLPDPIWILLAPLIAVGGLGIVLLILFLTGVLE